MDDIFKSRHPGTLEKQGPQSIESPQRGRQSTVMLPMTSHVQSSTPYWLTYLHMGACAVYNVSIRQTRDTLCLTLDSLQSHWKITGP